MKNFLINLLSDKRLKSLLWRSGMMVLAFIVSYLLENLSTFGLSSQITVILGLVLGEISKAINNTISK